MAYDRRGRNGFKPVAGERADVDSGASHFLYCPNHRILLRFASKPAPKGKAMVERSRDPRKISLGNDDKDTSHLEPQIGDKMPDGTRFAGISPDTQKPMYVT